MLAGEKKAAPTPERNDGNRRRANETRSGGDDLATWVASGGRSLLAGLGAGAGKRRGIGLAFPDSQHALCDLSPCGRKRAVFLGKQGCDRGTSRYLRSVLEDGSMPPWMPKEGFGNHRRNDQWTERERAIVLKALSSGAALDPSAPEAKPSEAGTELARTNLRVTLAEPFPLQAEGAAFYRSFVLPLGANPRRAVKAIRFRPSSGGAIASATIRQDVARFAQTLDAMDDRPGFSGPEGRMTAGDRLIVWTPAQPVIDLSEHPWMLESRADLVVDLQLTPTGKAAEVNFELAFEFADPGTASTAGLEVLHLSLTDFTVPADKERYVQRRSLPMELGFEAVSVSVSAGPHCREVKLYAIQGGSSPIPLLWIDDWNERWRQEFTFTEPVAIPDDSEIVAEFVFDGTASSGDDSPSGPVQWGLGEDAEHAEFWLNVRPNEPSQAATLRQAFAKLERDLLIRGYEFLLKEDPDHFEANARLGHVLTGENRGDEALKYLQTAQRGNPDSWNVQHNLGLVHVSKGQVDEAAKSFARAVELRPGYLPARKGLALSLAMNGDREASLPHFDAYLKARPDDFETLNNYGVILVRLGRHDEAERAYRKALAAGGERSGVHGNLAALLAATERREEAEDLLRGGIAVSPVAKAQQLRLQLARMLAAAGRTDEVREVLQEVLAIDPQNVDAKNGLKALEEAGAGQ